MEGATLSVQAQNTSAIDKNEQIKIDFYKTYDVMTGIRIAATLGGFFGLMVILVIYKSRNKTLKALKDPKIAEIAAAAVAEEDAEEEERQLAYALEEALGARGSLVGSSPWSPWPYRGPRFSSVGGGYSSLLAPPRRLSKMRGDSLPASSLRFDYRTPFFENDIELSNTVDDPSCVGASEYVNQYLAVPRGSRRFSNLTCSSSGSSYLERRGSSLVCALPTVPPSLQHSRPRPRRSFSHHESDSKDLPNPINIQVIQPTPELSPCVSEHTILDCDARYKKRLDSNSGVSEVRGKAPLASIGSCGVSFSVDYKDYDLHSVGSDSVFFEGEDCLDTDDEVEPFSTDSDESKSRSCHEDSKDVKPKRRSRHNIVGKSIPVEVSPPLNAVSTLAHSSRSPIVKRHNSFLSKPISRRSLRRLSHPTVIGRQGCSTISGAVAKNTENKDDSIVQDVELGSRPGLPTLHSNSGSVDFSMKSPEPLNPEHCSWSQETLF